ncbi:MAG TPA: hypothetical protein VK471_05745 [Solirubrobacterales bacterium]|nr:hypothetical protein [Solirubrobacterales bacterium]
MAVLLLGGGCGSDSAGGSESTEITVETGSLPKAQFLKRADVICGKALYKMRRTFQTRFIEIKDRPLAEQRAEVPRLVRRALIPAIEVQIDRLSSLGAPAGDEGEITAFLEAMVQGLAKAKEDPSGFIGNPESFAKPRRLGEAYGFASCGGV